MVLLGLGIEAIEAVLFYSHDSILLDEPHRPETDTRSIFPRALNLVPRACLEWVHGPHLRCAAPTSGLGQALGIVDHGPKASLIDAFLNAS